jgi:V/A-type H+-transporting ATPase subunit I
MFGILLHIVREAKFTSLTTGLLDHGPWFALFASLVLWGGNTTGLIPGEHTYFIWGIYASLAALVLTQGRNEKGIIKKAFMGVLSLYNSINYFSDVLSYSRLLALGLATSALAFAVNLIASMVASVPFVGSLLVVAVLVVGHLFNLAVNLLGAFIHSARLQFVEFFGKFITGNGKDFAPFARKERFVVLK